MPKQLLFNEEARAALKKGVDKLAEAVKMTLGPRGRAVVIEKGYGAPQVTFDGVTVAKEIELENKFENLGAELIKQAADKTNDNVGDGTTTSVVLAHAMIDEGEKVIREKGFNVIQLAEELKNAGATVVKNLESQREVINDNKKIEEVATLSAKDASVGKLIAEVMHKVGRDGVVTIEDSNTTANSYEVVEGMQFDRGYISPYMVTNAERMEAALEEPLILVTDKKISSIKEMLPLLEKLIEQGKKELVMIAEDVDGEALATLVVNKIRGIFTAVAVKAPGFGDRKKEMLQDLAIVTGATLVTEELGKKIEDVEIGDLGRAHRVVANKDNTTIVGGAGDKKAIDERVAQLKSQLKKTDSEYDKEKLQERVGKLTGGVAVLKVGAPTESAQKELKQRVEDAVAATRAAMEEGIVPGGGIALFNVFQTEKAGAKGDDAPVMKAARAILMHALESPLTAIVTNSGQSPAVVMSELGKQKAAAKADGMWVGFNADKGEIGDLRKSGIIDPLKVTKTAFLNALSVASNYLVTGAAVTEIPKKDTPPMPGAPGMGGMGEY
ncbi:MAG: chaperonin GroEL [Candidatus Harrisonbacteria bacterium]|nr:chaperonin GroEL [Candidatus Harrisonbacteria bacterium]